MLTRREFLEAGATAGTALALAPYGCAGERAAPGVLVNDIHSQLNATRVHRVVKPASADAVVQLVRRRARSEEHTSELQSRPHLVCRLLLEKKKRRQVARRHVRTSQRGSLLRSGPA